MAAFVSRQLAPSAAFWGVFSSRARNADRRGCRFYRYYCTSGKASLDMELDGHKQKYPGLKRVSFEDFMRTHPMDKLAGTMGEVGTNI